MLCARERERRGGASAWRIIDQLECIIVHQMLYHADDIKRIDNNAII